ncbi:MAG: hypothetical protein GY708_10555 [Actinomycetia bacterium]|nr:hypothetical protein [Actinomycetes bacterium]MCP4963528.1 hypothetical protein [Actinomycetes bacterium]
MTDVFRVMQLSDTHFLGDGAIAEGGFAYDTSEAFDAVLAHAGRGAAGADLVVVTGDVADHGLPSQYRHAAEALGNFDLPVNICPGNHDLDATFTATLGRPGLSTTRVIEAGVWAFLFVDSNAGGMETDESGRQVDPQDPLERLHRNGTLGAREMAWVRDMCDTVDAPNVFVWVHHPPAPRVPMANDPDYSTEWAALLAGLPQVKGFGAGHTHIPDVYEFHGREVFVAPALKHCFDLENKTWLPPGYRTFEFGADGSVASELHLVEDDRWPRNLMGTAIVSLFNGELTFDELAEIVARRQAQ